MPVFGGSIDNTLGMRQYPRLVRTSARAQDTWTQTQTTAQTQTGHRCSQQGSKLAVACETYGEN
eukprot:327230-Lingulodinium_polyedra.AAC.1